jgi:hypothetical protein
LCTIKRGEPFWNFPRKHGKFFSESSRLVIGFFSEMYFVAPALSLNRGADKAPGHLRTERGGGGFTTDTVSWLSPKHVRITVRFHQKNIGAIMSLYSQKYAKIEPHIMPIIGQ